ncbi:hypothetical protein [Tenacibaculum salmonis]|uniref:hypothetical protein n=1 Tax=Tenacibaculum sp. P3-BQ1 TaxID=3232310 RepID=UPI0034DF1E9B
MINTKLKNNGFITFLLVLIILIGVLSYQNANEYSELKDTFNLEKKELVSELSSVLKKYENTLYVKDDISLKLRGKLHEIIKLKDTINNLKTTDYNLFRFYRKRISVLIEQNNILFSYIDSLNSKNNQLSIKNDSVTEVLVLKENQNLKLKYRNRSLYEQKKVLKEKIAIAKVMQVSSVKVKAMKKKTSGKYRSTSKAKKTNAFKVAFNLLGNKISTPGLKTIYIQIIHNKNVIIPVKKVKLKNKEEILCNDILTANYNKKLLSIVSFIYVNNDNINKGSYLINIFIDGVFVKNTSINLK